MIFKTIIRNPSSNFLLKEFVNSIEVETKKSESYLIRKKRLNE